MLRLQAAIFGVLVAGLRATWPEVPVEETIGELGELVSAGKVRRIGMSECTVDGKCERTAPQDGNNLPPFLRVDVKGGVLTANDGSGRKTDIKASSVVGEQLMLQGIDNGKAWNMVIGSGTGRWGGSVVEDDGSFAIFGACTLP